MKSKEVGSQGDPNTALTLRASKTLARLEKQGSDFTGVAIEIKRIGELFFPKFYKEATKTNQASSQQKKLVDVQQESILMTSLVFTSILIQNNKEKHIATELKKLKKLEDAERCILESTGIAAFKKWLQKQKNEQEKLLEVSGKKRLVENLLSLKITIETLPLYVDAMTLKSFIKQLSDWVKIVRTLEKQVMERPILAKLANSIGSELDATWNQNRVLLSLTVALTIQSDTVSFSIEHIKKFCEEIRKPDWKERIEGDFKLFSLNEEDSVDLLSNKILQDIISELLLKKNQNLFYFLGKLSLSNFNDFKSLKELQKILPLAMEHAIKNSNRESLYIQDAQRVCREVRKMIHMLSTKKLYIFLQRNPYYISWLNEEELLRIFVLNTKLHLLTNEIALYADDTALGNITHITNQTISVNELMSNFFNGVGVFNFSFSFFNKHNSLQNNSKNNRGLSNLEENRLNNRILYAITFGLSPVEFSNWLKKIEKNNHTIDLTSVSNYKLLASYISLPENMRSSQLQSSITEKKWSKLLDTSLFEYFIENTKYSKIAARKYKNTFTKEDFILYP